MIGRATIRFILGIATIIGTSFVVAGWILLCHPWRLNECVNGQRQSR